jgi:predicted acylesterase/phospholipase RssA
MDLILSSGFLAFARHVGVLKVIEEKGIVVDGICGTSSGA